MLFNGNPKRGFYGTKKVPFKIQAASVEKFDVEYAEETQIMKGGAKPEIIIKDEWDNVLQEGIDYSVSFTNNKK